MKSNFIIAAVITFVVMASISVLYYTDSISTDNFDMNQSIGTVNTVMASPTMGLSNAPITIIEFGDYQCPNCKTWFLNTKPELTSNYIDTGKVNLIFVDIAFLGKDSLPASAATYCADEQGRYWDYHGFLYTNQIGIDTGWANSDSLKGYANNLGLDMNLFESCLDSGKYEKRVEFNTNEARRNGITGTPTFLIVGSDGSQSKIVGPQPFSVFDEVLQPMV